jgi:glycosyltransferase involved in cell wall biosynthesis
MDDSRPGATLPVAVVIPCYKVRSHIAEVLAGLAGLVQHIYVVDDCCPEQTGRFVQESCSNVGVTVLFLAENQGVGGAVLAGYRRALDDGHDVIVKLDGDNQMDPAFLPALVAPLLRGEADYAKGNRFFDVYTLSAMPSVRLIGNAGLSFIMKATSGYWDIMDPTNGYTAIHRAALQRLPLERLERRYFFECDMLFRLATIRAVVRDLAMPTIYGDEISNLKVSRILLEFPRRFVIRMIKRFFYMYILRDFNIASVETILGMILLTFGVVFGVWHWVESVNTGQFASTGTVMLAVLPIVVGVQLLLSAIGFDIANRPDMPLQKRFGMSVAGSQDSTHRHDTP